ncbi:MAG: hypothetical protein KKC75_03005 [Nanoarchaeota archaeon]|nr:hypothetical protein [Nanoarchaeota archaeon]MBU1004557.1 hypothetical protein [Nanoarchaeota archaeon]MBU1945796.1 hypothetical protein [Nanoarchaeota archaeon]
MAWYLSALLYVWDLFKIWITTIFVVPFRNPEMLWILVPVILGWFFAEFFQEKAGTSMGNAITNSIIVVWGSIDCTRQTVKLISGGILKSTGDIIARFSIIVSIMIYGISIIVLGLKGNKIIRYIGRVREVTYVFVMFVPVFYNAIPFSVNHIIASIVFFPLGYIIIEIIDRITPDPKAVVEDREAGGGQSQSSFGRAKQEEDFSKFDSFGQNDTQLNRNQFNPRF